MAAACHTDTLLVSSPCTGLWGTVLTHPPVTCRLQCTLARRVISDRYTTLHGAGPVVNSAVCTPSVVVCVCVCERAEHFLCARERNVGLHKSLGHKCSWQHYLEQPQSGSAPCARQPRMRPTVCGASRQRSIKDRTSRPYAKREWPAPSRTPDACLPAQGTSRTDSLQTESRDRSVPAAPSPARARHRHPGPHVFSRCAALPAPREACPCAGSSAPRPVTPASPCPVPQGRHRGAAQS